MATVNIPILEVFRVSNHCLTYEIEGGAGYPF